MTKKHLVSEISAEPARSINMGNRGWATLSAGAKIKLDPPLELGSKELGEAWEQLGKEIRAEFKRQYEPYKKMMAKGGDKHGE